MVDDDLYPINIFDLLLDLRSKDLHEKVSKQLKIKYLSESPYTELKEVNGITFGPYLRVIISLPVTVKQKTKNVHFILDTGSPKTFVCEEVFESFNIFTSRTGIGTMMINNQPTVVHLSPPDSHFTDTNILGMEYLKVSRANLTITLGGDYDDVFLSFDSLSHKDKNMYQLQSTFQIGGIVLLVTMVSVVIFKKKPVFFLLIAIILLSYIILQRVQD